MAETNRVFIIVAKRTAIGKFLGAFQCDFSRDRAGNCQKNLNTVRHSGGGSGIQAIRNGMNEIRCGNRLVLCGGFEFMSNIPFATNSYIRMGKKFGDFTMTDLMTHDGLIDSFSGVHMGITAENVARKYAISREMQDQYSLMAQQRAIAAVDRGVFKEEIVPVCLKDYKNREYVFDTDEFPDRDTSMEKLSALKPILWKNRAGDPSLPSAALSVSMAISGRLIMPLQKQAS